MVNGIYTADFDYSRVLGFIGTLFSLPIDSHLCACVFVSLSVPRSTKWEHSSGCTYPACRTSWVWYFSCVSPGLSVRQESWVPSPLSPCAAFVWVIYNLNNVIGKGKWHVQRGKKEMRCIMSLLFVKNKTSGILWTMDRPTSVPLGHSVSFYKCVIGNNEQWTMFEVASETWGTADKLSANQYTLL